MTTSSWKYGPGRPRLRAIAEESLPLDVRMVQRAGMLCNGYVGTLTWRHSSSGEPAGRVSFSATGSSIRLDYCVNRKPRTQLVSFARTGCHFGGSRPWFACPLCSKRAAVLYAPDGRFGCRHCQRIGYQSQAEDFNRRLYRKENKIRERLEPSLKRRKGMHTSTFKRLLAAFDQISERQIDAETSRAIARGWG
jgi:hypothetical protein